MCEEKYYNLHLNNIPNSLSRIRFIEPSFFYRIKHRKRSKKQGTLLHTYVSFYKYVCIFNLFGCTK